MTDDQKGPDGPVKGHATATKEGDGWVVKFDDTFIEELKHMDPVEREQVEMLVEGLKNGTIDPMTMGKRMCGYCGEPIEEGTDVGINMCNKCKSNLV